MSANVQEVASDKSEDLECGSNGAFGADVEQQVPEPHVSLRTDDGAKQELSPLVLRMRWKSTLAAVCLNVPVALYFASAVIMPYMNSLSHDPWLAPGITQPALMHTVATMVIMPCMGNFLPRLSPRRIWMASITSLASPVLIGVSTHPGCAWLQYLGAVVASPGFAVGLQFRALNLQWWSLDDRAAIGSALHNGLTGLQMVAFCLVSAHLFSSIGFEYGMYAITVIMLACLLFPLLLAIRGELGGPALMSTLEPPQGCLSTMPKSSASNVPMAACSANHCIARNFWHLFFHLACFPFVGFGMKALTTTIFQTAYGQTYLESTNLTAISLSLFVVVRSGLPLVSHRLSVTRLSACLMTFSAVLYASYPTIIAHAPVWVLLLAKTLSGATYAGTGGVQMLLLMEVYSPSELPKIWAKLGFALGIGFGLGPLVGHYIQTLEGRRGSDAHHAFNPFFYLCATVAALDAVNIMCLDSKSGKATDTAASKQHANVKVGMHSSDVAGKQSSSS